MEKNPKDAKGAKSAKAKKRGRASAAQKSQQARATPFPGTNLKIFTEHTPPPIVIESGSLIIETGDGIKPPVTSTSQAHPHRYEFADTTRPIVGLRILNDADSTIYLNSEAQSDGCSVRIWYDNSTGKAEQIFVEGPTRSIEADVDLGPSAQIMVPPKNPQRTHRFTHPSANAADGIVQVEVIDGKGDRLFFSKSDRLGKVMIWDKAD